MPTSLTEFSLINTYFTQLSKQRDDVCLGIGDDAAVVQIPAGKQLVVATDTLVAGVHFLEHWSAKDIAYKALAVNLSDLAAMAATPAWVTLALTLPTVDDAWLTDFSHGFAELLQQYQLQLIGGDTTQGPLTINVTVLGLVESNHYLCRSTAKVGDTVYVTGELGAAALAVKDIHEQALTASDRLQALQQLLRPQPRIKEGQALSTIAHAAIDLSDGLAADLQHILQASQVGATLELENLPVASVCLANLTELDARLLALTGGDDYQLCFTAAADSDKTLQALAKQLDCRMTPIGVIDAKPGLRCQWQGKAIELPKKRGYEHFANS